VPSDLTEAVFAALGVAFEQGQSWLLAWARVMPMIVLVPAFGLRAVPAPMRVALAFGLAVSVAPALQPANYHGPWAALLGLEFLRGLPAAITAATTLWVASMAGGLIDNLRAGQQTVLLPHVEPGSTPVGALLSMLVAIAFLQGGGAAHTVAALARSQTVSPTVWAAVANQLAAGVGLAVAVAAPVVGVAIVAEVASALIARAASPAFLQPTLAPLRTVAILGAAALLLDRMAEFLVLMLR